MRRSHPERISSLLAERDEAVLAIPLIEDGREVVEYSADTETTPPPRLPGSVQDALDLAGVWSELDWNETGEVLERIRHEK